jgi:predicted RNA-binding protein YlqC (UPF0109 family)
MKQIAKKINDNDESIVINLINPNPPEKKKKTKIKYEKNEQGQKITKKGEIHKAIGRDMSKAQEGLKKWREQQKKLKEEEKGKTHIINDDDESDSDIEYEIDDIEVKKPEAKVIEKEIVKEIEKEVIKEVPVEIIKPDLNVVKENEELKQKNKKLEESFNFNQHLNRISSMSRQTNLKF